MPCFEMGLLAFIFVSASQTCERQTVVLFYVGLILTFRHRASSM